MVFKHKKNQKNYTLLKWNKDYVIYVGHDDGIIWWRPFVEFFDGRFEVQPTEQPLSPEEIGAVRA